MLNNEGLSEPRASLEEFYNWVESLPLDEADTALKGLLEYEKEIQKELFHQYGWHSVVED